MPTWATWYFLSEWAVRLAMLVYVPQRRSPAAARTWLLLIFILPWPGLLLYTIFGRARLPRRRLEAAGRVSHLLRTTGKEFFARYAAPPAVGAKFAPAVTLAENLGDFGILGGNRVELLDDYSGALDRLAADVAAARRHVHLLYYIFADDATGRRLADILIAAAGRGVECRLLVDGLASRKSRRRLLPRLRVAGVEVVEVLPVSLLRREARFDLRNHRKIALIDGAIAYVGSQNIVDADFKPGIVYEELVARVTGPVVLQLQAVFLADHLFETEQQRDVGPYLPEPDRPGAAPAQVLPSGPWYPRANYQRLIVALVHAAQRRIVITTPYFIPDEALLQALETVALRGVEVHLIVSRVADQLLVALAQKSYYEGLLEAGVQIHLYRPRFLHAKHLSIDDTITVIGSSNMDVRSFALNAEVSLIVYDESVAAAQRAIQDRYLAASDRLGLEEWRRRPFLARVAQNTARLVDSVL